MIDLNQSTENQKRKNKRILIGEPEPDIHYLYSLFTKHYGFSISDVNIVESGNKCLKIVILIQQKTTITNMIPLCWIPIFMTFQALKLLERFVIDYHIKK